MKEGKAFGHKWHLRWAFEDEQERIKSISYKNTNLNIEVEKW